MNKLLDGLLKRMDNIFDEKERIFWEKRPWEFDPPTREYSEEEKLKCWQDTPQEVQLTMELHKVFEAIDRQLHPLVEKKEPILNQSTLLFES
jgi:hypothetical protein